MACLGVAGSTGQRPHRGDRYPGLVLPCGHATTFVRRRRNPTEHSPASFCEIGLHDVVASFQLDKLVVDLDAALEADLRYDPAGFLSTLDGHRLHVEPRHSAER